MDQRHLDERLSCFGTKVGGKLHSAYNTIKYSAGRVGLIENCSHLLPLSILCSELSMADVTLGLFSHWLIQGTCYMLDTGNKRELWEKSISLHWFSSLGEKQQQLWDVRVSGQNSREKGWSEWLGKSVS